MRNGLLLSIAILGLSVGAAHGQSSAGPNAPTAKTFCSTDSGVTWTPCNPSGGGGGGGGAVTQSTGSASFPWWFQGLGTAGTPSGGVMTVQGASGGQAVPVSATALPLPTGAATAANQATIITTLGTPFQAGASIGNTAFGVTGALPAGTNAIGTVTTTPKTGAATVAGCTIGTSSAQCLAASTATNSLFVQNTSATASIACSEGGTAILNSSGSYQLGPGASMLWGPSTAGPPSAAINCIASAASTPLLVRYN
jgi:hypothetical protein